jgi:hypothetical protein
MMQESGNQPAQAGRPQMLTVLCVLSYIGSGLASFAFFSIWSAYHEVMPALAESEDLFPEMEYFISAGRNFYLAGFILYFLSLIGVSLMWRMRKSGFHFYTGAQVMITLLPLVYIDGFPFSFLEWMVTALFIILYARFYRLFT